MFQVLTESGPRARAETHRYLVSLSIHAVLVVLVVGMIRPSTDGERRQPAATIMHFEAARPVARAPNPILPAAPDVHSMGEVPDLPSSPLGNDLPTVADALRNAASTTATSPDFRELALGDGASFSADSLFADAAVDDPVEIIRQPVPQYPAALAQAGIAGRVQLSYVVDTTGQVEPGSIHTIASSHPGFEAVAHAAVLASRFRPAKVRGRVVRQLVRQTLSFRLAE